MMPEPSQKEPRETMEEVEDNQLFYEPPRYCVQTMCYEDLLPPKVLDMRKRRVRRCG